MGGPFNYPPGSYSDDTEMTIPIARIAARGDDLIEHIPEIIKSWRDWLAQGPRDVGSQTRAVLSSLPSNDEAEAWKVSKNFFERSGQAAGNGALMRTAPVALAYLDEPVRMAEAARRIAQLTHFEDDAWQSCVLWCASIRHAILESKLNFKAGLDLLPQDSRKPWEGRIEEALVSSPRDFPNNGWTVHALQTAIAAVNTTQTAPEALFAAVKAGGDTDTVAAIAGSLAGAYYGVSSLPAEWRVELNGWPDMNSRGLTNLALRTVNKGSVRNPASWPNTDVELSLVPKSVVPHPLDPDVLLGNLNALNDMENIERVDVAVALCRVGNFQTKLPLEEFWLVDSEDSNLELDFVLLDAAARIQKHRSQGKRVLVFCYAGQSRTPAVGATYSIVNFCIPPMEAIRQIHETSNTFRMQNFFVPRIAGFTPQKPRNN